jgi:hypothetical protein
MASAAVGPPLVEFQHHRAVGHVSHMPHRPVVERGDFHHETFRAQKKAGAAPEGAAPAVMNLEIVVGRLRSAALAANWRNEDDDAQSA